MTRKSIFFSIAVLLVISGVAFSFQTRPAHAQGADDPTVQITGVLRSISRRLIVLMDGTRIRVSGNATIPANLTRGQTITILAERKGKQLEAKRVVLGTSLTNPTTFGNGSDDKPGHDVNDDHGDGRGQGTDERPGHDANDDHGGRG
jgi:hypothetical protein